MATRHGLHRLRRGGGARHGCPRDQGARSPRSTRARSGSGPWPGWWPASACRSSSSAGPAGDAGRAPVLDEVRDVMRGWGKRDGHRPRRLPGPRPGRDGRPRGRAGAPMMILTIDFGTTVTKVGLWSEDGLGGADPIRADHHPSAGRLGRAGPAALVDLGGHRLRRVAGAGPGGLRSGRCRRLLGGAADLRAGDASGDPIGKGILWSDRRGVAEAPVLTEALGGEDINRARTGIPLDAGAMAAKLAWLAAHEPDRLSASATSSSRPATSCCGA